ncbi:putative glucose-6-phosphate 1-epimerase [Vitis vinifera]|uniref:glucose-6-phosphate 1-epimerase n=1 Tax=Vitis vinifera TaxID=29760 RepID=A0A438EVU1_VITVI|nr:putative glucose-6-phosphate 1-epimerase [Vitis vinifera]
MLTFEAAGDSYTRCGTQTKMATLSMVPTSTLLASSNLGRVNRYSGMAFASSVKEVKGEGNLPKLVLTSTHGSEAEIYLFGGCVTSWKAASGKDLLFVRPDAVFNGQKPISSCGSGSCLVQAGVANSLSGGVPHCFPQFGPGPMQQHGFARNMNWSVVDSENVEGNPVVTLELKDGPYSRSMWDFSFRALYKVILNKNSLSTELVITNTDKKPFSFSTALHTYFSASVTGASVKGLKGCKTLNKDLDPTNPLEGKEERDVVTFPGFVDCIYLDAPNVLHLDNGLGDVITVKNINWSDTVLWNPYLQMEACYRDFVCVENAKIGKVQLEPEQSWSAIQHLSID